MFVAKSMENEKIIFKNRYRNVKIFIGLNLYFSEEQHYDILSKKHKMTTLKSLPL